MFSDLECDYINPIDLCNKLNQVRPCLLLTPWRGRRAHHARRQFVLPENAAHAALTVLFLLSGQWIAFLLNAPLLAYNANKYVLLLLLLPPLCAPYAFPHRRMRRVIRARART
jgi:hypothetical protein